MDYNEVDIGQRLRQQRQRANHTQQEIADKLGMSRANLAAIELGQRRLTSEQIMSLAAAYGLQVNRLLQQAVPAPRLAAQFRIPYSRGEARTELEGAIAALEALVEKYLELERLLDASLQSLPVPPYSVDSSAIEASADAIADTERRRLGLSDGPLPELRDVLERDVGLRIFSLVLPGEVAGIFGLSPVAGGCVGINSRHPASRQRWSLAHEYAHFLTDRTRSEITKLRDRYQRLPDAERFAERFAAAFLMPRSGLERRLGEVVRRGRSATIADLLVLSNEYGVSAQALVLRLEDLNVVSSGQWDRFEASRIDLSAAGRMLQLPDRLPDSRRFPKRYMLLALEAYDRELLTERQLGEYLEMDRLAVRALLDDLARSPVDTSSGVQEIELDLSSPVEFLSGSPRAH